MKILLIIPPVSLHGSYGKLKDFSNPQPSIGLAYIAAVLRKNGYDVRVLDAYVQQLELKEILTIVGEAPPQVIGMTLLTTSADVVEQISSHIRERHPSTTIVLGNIHASLFCEEILKKHSADVIVHREGEHTFTELVQAFDQGLDLGQVKGISYLEKGKVVHTPKRDLIEDLDSLPFPAWDLFPLKAYKTDPRTQIVPGETEMQILATRGCPNACTFCSSHSEKSLGSKYRMRSPKNIVDEMTHMHRHFKTKVFSFMDLAFPLKKRHAMGVFNEIIDRGLNRKIAWTTECRVKPLDQETLNRMRKAGCARINFGIESGSNRILRLLKKNFTTEDVRHAVFMAKKSGIEVDGMFMMGLPSETEDEIRATVDLAISLDVRFAIFNIFVPYPGCELYDELNGSGRIRFHDWSDFTSYPTYTGRRPVYVPDGLSHGKLMSLQSRAMKRFYLRPRFILNEIAHFKPSKMAHYLRGFKAVLAMH